MSLWSEYIAELRGPDFRKWLEDEDGFVAYSLPIDGECIIVHDMYVKPEVRKMGIGKEYLKKICEIGKEAGRKFVISEVELATGVTASSMAAQLAVGFVPVKTSPDTIYLRKVIDG
jgi:GNAT superfamily N-acetyltransferase